MCVYVCGKCFDDLTGLDSINWVHFIVVPQLKSAKHHIGVVP